MGTDFSGPDASPGPKTFFRLLTFVAKATPPCATRESVISSLRAGMGEAFRVGARRSFFQGSIVHVLTHLDLFSGIGGFALAARWAGFRTIGFSEIEPYACGRLSENFPDVRNYGDATKLNQRNFASLSTHGFPDIITGGVPCQPASLIGERRGTEDERWLWPDTIRIMREFRPDYGVFENPAAILGLESGRAFSGILGGLAEIGYDVQWHCVPASCLGAGHRRERVWILAANSDRERLEGHPGNGEGIGRPEPDRSVAAPDLRDRKFTSEKWYHQSGLQPVVNGLSSRMARERLHAVGNALVPQVAHVFLRAIANIAGQIA